MREKVNYLVNIRRANGTEILKAREFTMKYLEIMYSDVDLEEYTCYIALIENTLAATMYVSSCNALSCNWQINYCVTHPKYRGRGIMTDMVNTVCAVFRGQILVEAYAKGEVAEMHEVLTRNGFRCVGVLRDYWRSNVGCEGCPSNCALGDICDNHLYIKSN